MKLGEVVEHMVTTTVLLIALLTDMPSVKVIPFKVLLRSR